MATQDDTKSNSVMHQVPIMARKPVEMYRLLPTQHSVSTNNANWILVPGLQKTVKVVDKIVDVVIMAHCHANATQSQARVDLGLFINGKQVGIDGEKQAPGWGQVGGNGMGLSHTPTWVPMMSIASCQLPKSDNDYVIDCRVRGNSSNVNVSCNGTGMLIQVFKPQQYMKWIDIDLDDDKYFNFNLEYRIQLKGKSFANAMTVEKEKLWFFYADDKNSENSGIKCIGFKDKRSFDEKYFVTKIQCCTR